MCFFEDIFQGRTNVNYLRIFSQEQEENHHWFLRIFFTRTNRSTNGDFWRIFSEGSIDQQMWFLSRIFSQGPTYHLMRILKDQQTKKVNVVNIFSQKPTNVDFWRIFSQGPTKENFEGYFLNDRQTKMNISQRPTKVRFLDYFQRRKSSTNVFFSDQQNNKRVFFKKKRSRILR